MEDIWQEGEYYGELKPKSSFPQKTQQNPQLSIAARMKRLEAENERLKMQKESKEQTKEFKFPFRWNWKFGQSRKKANIEKVLVLFLNKKNEIEPPKFIPVYSGNIIIYKNKAYEFDPRGIWRMKGVKGIPSVYLIKEIDRRPIRNPNTGKWIRDNSGRLVYSKDAAVSNMDIEEIRERGDSTESDEFLIKAALKAYTSSKTTKPVNWIVIGIVVIVVCLGAWFLLRSNLGA